MSLNSTGWPGIAPQIRAKCQHRPKWTVVSRGVNEVKSSGGLVQSPMLQENQILPPMSQLNLSPIASAPTPP